MTPLPLSYVLPIRWQRDRGLAELGAYLHALAPAVAELIVVDGSPPARFALHARALPGTARHVRPDPLGSAMGKVDGVLTGLRLAREEAVVIADDDVRWRVSELARALRLLGDFDLVRPQNYFAPLPWHARLDTARTLINRAWSAAPELGPGDFPGTLVVRRETLARAGGYRGDAIFENLELIRTVLAAGGRMATPLDLYVRRLPPDTRHFLSQRVRQAYDELALPRRMAVWLATLPALAARPRVAGPLLAALALALAEAGRRRAGGRERFPATSVALAPVWLAERAVCAWLAVATRLLRGGVRYGDRRVPRAASGLAELRRRQAGRATGSGAAASPSANPAA